MRAAAGSLELAQTTFANGRIYPKSGSPLVLVYEVSSTRALHETVIRFFERYVVPFTCKGETFACFREIVEMMIRKEHLAPAGLAQVVRLAYAMNPAGKGRARQRPLDDVLERILRGHTSDTLQAA